MEEEIKRIAKAIIDSKKVTVLTGAGISTESGIPDFRSEKTGLWNKFDPNLLSKEFLYKDPQKFYDYGLKMLSSLRIGGKIKPNKAHYILADMEKSGWISCVITQNIDGLHKMAGSKKVFEVHGNIKKSYCISCKMEYPLSMLYKKVLKKQIPPLCPKCKGMIRTSIVLFGDELNEEFYAARKEVMESDLLIVIGSSLEVGPVNTLPLLARKFAIINKEKTFFDEQAFVVVYENAGKALLDICKNLG